MTPEINPMDPALEQAVSEIRDEADRCRRWWKPPPPACGRALPREASGRIRPPTHIRGCADFQALIPDYRAGQLAEARALLLKDHLHQCVACRRGLRRQSGGVAAAWRPERAVAGRPQYAVRWAAAAAVVAAAGVSVRGSLCEPLSHRSWKGGCAGRERSAVTRSRRQASASRRWQKSLTAGVEIRTAKDSVATLATVGRIDRGTARTLRRFRPPRAARTSTCAWTAAASWCRRPSGAPDISMSRRPIAAWR